MNHKLTAAAMANICVKHGIEPNLAFCQDIAVAEAALWASSSAPPAAPSHATPESILHFGRMEIYADGACKGNPGRGGWGVFLTADDGQVTELFGGEQNTTNNRMELTAACEALRAVAPGSHVILWTDSQYVKDGITKWVAGWKRNGWVTAQRTPVKNADLWVELDKLRNKVTVDWRWVKGHAGHPGNERADRLANKGAESVRR